MNPAAVPKKPGFFAPYFHDEPLLIDEAGDYVDPEARLANSATCQWIHPLGRIVTGLIQAGLSLRWLHEHETITWRMFACLQQDSTGQFHWPDRPWLPLAFSLLAEKQAG